MLLVIRTLWKQWSCAKGVGKRGFLFVCAEVLQPSKPIRVLLSAVILPNHTSYTDLDL